MVKAQQARQGWLARAKEVPRNLVNRGVAKAKATYGKLEARYGRKYAIAIMGAGLAGVPLPVPGGSFLTAAPMVGIAELHRALSRRRSESCETGLCENDIEALGKQFVADVVAAYDSHGEGDTDLDRYLASVAQRAGRPLTDEETAAWVDHYLDAKQTKEAVAPKAKGGEVAMGGKPGATVERLMDKAIRTGGAELGRLARGAIARLLRSPTGSLHATSLFTHAERIELAEMLASVRGSANLLGRALVRDFQQRVERQHKGESRVGVPPRRQATDYSCGAAALQAACAFYGVGPESQADFARALHTTAADGTDADRIEAYARQLGLGVISDDGLTVNDLAGVLPAIASVTMYGGSHWVVVTGIEGGRVYFMDPGEGAERSLPAEEFAALWAADAGQFAIAIRPPLSAESDLHKDLACGLRLRREDEGNKDPKAKLVKPEKAVDYFKSLVPKLDVDPGRFGEEMRREAFTLAVATDQELLGKVQKIITDRLDTGVGISSGPREIKAVLDAAGVTPKNPQYSEMVFRTNTMDAYNTGADKERMDPDVIETFPVWQYAGIDDGRQRDEHEKHFNKYYPANVAFATVRDSIKFSPWNCRCTSIPVTKWEWAKLAAAGAMIADGYPQVEVTLRKAA